MKPLPNPLLGQGEGIRKDTSRGIRTRGFTLIEMMLAIGVLGLILAMLATSFSTVAHSKVHAEGRLLVDREGRALLWQISKEVRDAVFTPIAPSHVLLLGGGHVGSSGPLDTITLSTLDAGHRRAITGIAPEYIVSYSEVSNPDHRGWYLLQRTQQSGLMLAPAAGQSIMLADNLLSLHLRYFDGQRWTESWDSSSLPPGRQLPIAVAIQIQMGAPGGRVMDFATQVTVPMAIQQW
jgi:prepilin-type N-terminal cleavage/methylation domain-containing protein